MSNALDALTNAYLKITNRRCKDGDVTEEEVVSAAASHLGTVLLNVHGQAAREDYLEQSIAELRRAVYGENIGRG